MRRRRSLLSNMLALGLGLVFGLVLCEIGTRIVSPQLLSGSWLVYGPRGVLMNKAGGDPVRNEMSDRSVVTYEFNSWHQRGRAEPDPKAARVLVLGDSFTFGSGVPLAQTYIGRMQAQFDARGDSPRVQLLNASAGGWGTADEMTYLEAFGDKLGLSAVVVFVDFGDPIRSARSGLYAVQADHQGLTPVDQSARRSRLKLLLEGNRFYNFLLEHSQLLQLVRVASVWGSTQPVTTLPPPPTPQEAQAQQEITRLLFRRMAAWCKARDIQLTVLTTGWDNFEFPWMGQMMREEGVTFHDLHDSVATVTGDRLLEDYSIPIDTHPNARGDGVIANAAWPILDQRLRGLPARPFSGF